MKFIDEAVITIKAGDGGRGCVSFRREKCVPRGGPDGGNGGRGGDMTFKASNDLRTLLDFTYKRVFQAGHGRHGMGSQCDGHAGEDMIIPVPVGTVLFNDNTGEPIADLEKDGQQITVARGGRGGRGNAFFKTSTRQAPKYAQPGEAGESVQVRLELKLIADVGLIGMPNAGKSTFLSVVSEARPRIASYPFTTVEPCLGVVAYQDAPSFVVADLPGLIEGAHEGRGMGDRFLRHAERTRVLLHLVSLGPDETINIFQRHEVIEQEMKKYFSDASQRKKLVVLTKADLGETADVCRVQEEMKEKYGVESVAVSAVKKQNVDVVLQRVLELLGNG